MTAVDDFLGELEASLHVRGRSRRRFLLECRDHLAESSTTHGPQEAVRRFGRATDLARGFELEVAVRRALRATIVSVAGVLGVGAAALVMLNAADTHASAPVGWAVVFFGFALVTLFAVGAGVPGRTSAWAVLAGPVVTAVAGVSIARTRWLARKLGPTSRAVRTPLADLAALAGRSVEAQESPWHAHPAAVLAPTVLIAMAAAFGWDLGDHGTVSGSSLAAGIEAAMTVAGFVFLGRILGLHAALGRHR